MPLLCGDDVDTEQYETAFMVPPHFICGISKNLMEDPVVVASGITYERAKIQAWLDSGNMCCPLTGKPLSHLQLVPNLTLKRLISSWMASHSGPLTAHLSGPMHTHERSSFSDGFCRGTFCCEHDTSTALQVADPVCVDYYSDFKLMPERRAKDVPILKSSFGEHVCKEANIPPPSKCIMSRIRTLINHMQSKCIDTQRHSITELRLLAKDDEYNRMMVAKAGAMVPLLELLRSEDEIIQQEATTTLLNLSLSHVVREDMITVGAVEPLVHIVKEGLSAVAMENATVALTNLSFDDENKAGIGAAGAIPPLLELLNSGSCRGEKDAAAALYRLTTIVENQKRVVRAGATRVLVNFMCDEEGITNNSNGMVEKAIAILGNLMSVEEGRVAFVEEGGIKPLLETMQRGSRRSRILAIPILYQLCSNSAKHRSLVLQWEPLPLLLGLSRSTNPRVQTEINEVLDILMKHMKLVLE